LFMGNKQDVNPFEFRFKGLFSDDTIKKYMNESNRYLIMFYDDLLKPYFFTKKYVSRKKDIHFEGKNIINKEGYAKHWYSYYKNYKRFILPKIKEIEVSK